MYRDKPSFNPGDSRLDFDYLYYSCNEETGTTIADGGDGNSLTVLGTNTGDATLWPTATINDGLHFDTVTADTCMVMDSTATNGFFDLTYFTGKLISSLWWYRSGDLSATEVLYSTGSLFGSAVEGLNTGGINMKISGSEVLQTGIAGPGDSLSQAGANQIVGISGIGTAARWMHVFAVFDLATATAPILSLYLDGDNKTSDVRTENQENGRPAPTEGLLSGRITGINYKTESAQRSLQLGASGGTNRIRHVMFGKMPASRFTTSEMDELANLFYRANGGIPRQVLGF